MTARRSSGRAPHETISQPPSHYGINGRCPDVAVTSRRRQRLSFPAMLSTWQSMRVAIQLAISTSLPAYGHSTMPPPLRVSVVALRHAGMFASASFSLSRSRLRAARGRAAAPSAHETAVAIVDGVSGDGFHEMMRRYGSPEEALGVAQQHAGWLMP